VDGDSDDGAREVVLDLVCAIPPGRVSTYGDLARLASDILPTPVTARMVGRHLRRAGPDVPWWRVVGHDGRLPPGLDVTAQRALLTEGVPLRGSRVDVRAARWSG
jgi:alkylated DNA nucleotide flippase Atl1